MAKVKIGLVGEDPSDTDAIRNLIGREFESVQFVSMLRNFNGSMLETASALRFLQTEFEEKRPKAVVFIRDLDGVRTEHKKIATRKAYFESCDLKVNGTGIPLLNIYSIEALLYADIETFNTEYKTNLKSGDPTMVMKPKETLKTKTSKLAKRYHESHNPVLFSKLNLETVKANCPYLADFVATLKERIK